MSQNPPPAGPPGENPQSGQPGQGGWPPAPQGGYPQGPQGGFPQGPQGGYPQGPQGGYPQGPPGGYPQGPQGGYPQGPPGGYPPGGFPPGPGGYQQGGGQPPKKSSAMIIGIVVAAVVLLAAIGGIVIALNRGGGDQPTTTITPGQPAPPTDEPSSPPPSPEPSGRDTPASKPPSSEPPSSQPPTSQPPTQDPQNPASPVSLGGGVSVTPAQGWELTRKGSGSAQFSDGRSLFAGMVGELEPSTSPTQFCDAYHKSLAEKATNGKFEDAKRLDLKTKKLKGASCLAQMTVTSGQGSGNVLLYSVVSIRTDGLTVVGTLYYTEATDTKELGDDFVSMVNSMLRGQAAG